MRIIFSLKWMNMTLSIPNLSRMMADLSSAELMSGTSTRFTSVSGCVSKVSTAGIALRSAARRLVISSSAAWPM